MVKYRNKGDTTVNILVIGGTRFFGIHMVNELLTAGYDVTIATRGKASIHLGIRLKGYFWKGLRKKVYERH